MLLIHENIDQQDLCMNQSDFIFYQYTDTQLNFLKDNQPTLYIQWRHQ